jgi:hypothetical protein
VIEIGNSRFRLGRVKDLPCAYGTGTMSRNTTRRSVDSGGVAKSAALSAAPRLPLGDPPVRPTFARERAAIRRGVFPVAGCDEAGRGPLAGPVVAAAVILDPNHIPRGLNDSKKLTAVERDKLYERIFATAEVGVAFGSRARIDRDNIRRASLWALARAVAALAVRPRLVFVDGIDRIDVDCDCEAVVCGASSGIWDMPCRSIAVHWRRSAPRCITAAASPRSWPPTTNAGTPQAGSATMLHPICLRCKEPHAWLVEHRARLSPHCASLHAGYTPGTL